MLSAFTHDRWNYNSASLGSLSHDFVCVTGVACEENFNDYVMAKKLLRQLTELMEQLQLSIDSTDQLVVEKSEFNVGEVASLDLKTEDLESYNPKLLNYWLRNRLLVHPYMNQVSSDQHGLVEFDIRLHQILNKANLLCWNRFTVLKVKNAS